MVPKGLMYPDFMAKRKREKNVPGARIWFPEHERWRALLDKKKVDQQEAIELLIKFVLDQDDVTQSMIFEQLDVRDDLIAIALQRLKSRVKYRSSTQAKKGQAQDSPR